MKVSLKIAGSLVVVVFSLAGLDRFLHWMNQPSDLYLYTGLLGVLGVVLFIPVAVSAIWSSGRGRRM